MAHILVIDDDTQVRRLISTILEREGHLVTQASDGASGLAQFHLHPADLVITDIFMPEKDGLQTIRELSRICLGLPIIAISGSEHCTTMDYLQVAGRFGACRVLDKPFAPEGLRVAVREELARRKAA